MKAPATHQTKRTPRGINGKRHNPSHGIIKKFSLTGKALVNETYQGESYQYFPLGKYVVAAPGVCGGRPTFKYTRVEARYALDLIAAGWSIEEIAYKFRQSQLTPAAVREAIELASRILVTNATAPQPA